MDFADSGIEEHAKSIEKSDKMLKLFESAIDFAPNKHKNGEDYYWLLYYSYLSPQQYKNADEIIELLRPHIALTLVIVPIFGGERKQSILYPQSFGATLPGTA